MSYIPELENCLWLVLKTKLRVPLKKNPTKSYSKPKHDNNGAEGRKKSDNLKNKQKTIRRRYN